MADTSRSQVTITLGRSGQVVKRSGAVVDDSYPPVPAAGIKRPVRDRLGSNADAEHLDNKRQRGINGRLSAKASNGLDDTHLSKHDLRFKIMKKSQRDGKQKNVDLRDMLSRKARPSATNQKMNQSFPEPRNDRQRVPQLTAEQKDDRRCMPEPKDGQWDSVEVRRRDDRRLMRDPIEVGPRDDRRLMRGPIEVGPRDDRRLIRDPAEVGPRDDRRLIRDPAEVGPRDDRRLIRHSVEVGPRDDGRLIRVPIEVGSRMHKLYNDRLLNLDPTDGSMPRRLASTRTSRTLSQMDLSKTSFSLESLDHISRPSLHKALDNSAGLSPPPPPPPPTEEPLRRPLISAFNDPRPVPYTSLDIREIPRPMASTSFPIKPAISDGPTKLLGPLVASQLPTGGMVQQSQYPVDYFTLEGFLHSLGLDKYMISFKVEEVDMATLSQMGDHDLKEMGIPMGPRKKILQALHAGNMRLVQ
ncbi:hypothetical protein L1987_16801 [Smallanthus sonchifolius]|uniref:Uncharacterized protein n=1 Tax=Smallanthus sonchifolius TaxID=185202 RepID=A0ACB9IYJ8_9ASTR|nr:hypothetical protein L1987_16801 [Smallanthus sonchifolius]